MDDKELVEVWRAEFESQFDDDLFARGSSGAYINHHRNSMWQGFLMARRHMQKITLKRSNWNPVLMGHFYSHGEVVNAITEAGYNYEVKE